MTRLASILGVATVATLILLSGCEAAVKTDYAKNLEGTWVSAELDRMLPDLNPADLMALTPVKTTVTAVITDGDGLNTGDLMLTVADTVSGTMTETVVSGSITVSKTEIVVTISGVEPMAVVDANPDAFAPLLAQPQTLTYTLSDDDSELTVASSLLPILLGPTHTELTFTK